MIRDILKKYILPGALAGMTIDSWYQSRFGSQSSSVLQLERNKLLVQYNKANSDLYDATKEMEDYKDRDFILKAKAHAVKEKSEIVNSKIMEIE